MLKRKLKSFRLSLGKWLIDSTGKTIKLDTKTSKKILFVHYDGKIGDYIVSSFAYNELKNQAELFKIDIAGAKGNKEIIEADSNISKLYILQKNSYYHIVKTGLLLKKEKYDVLINPAPQLRNRDLLFIRLVNSRLNIGYKKESYKIFGLNYLLPASHASNIYAQILTLIGIVPTNTHYILPQNPAKENEAYGFVENICGKKIIAINLFGASRSRKFTKETALLLLDTIKTAFPGYTYVLLTYPAINSIVSEIINEANDPEFCSFQQTTSIFHTIAIIRKAALVVTPDTAIVHISDALDKPLLAFYSDEEDNFVRWHPVGEKAVVVRYISNINNVSFSKVENALKKIADA
ncbi:glycosyltransferase family 9 protein [Parasediminibacterium sp. JCM 36343]|uniref:glycosyltransferase family 9 protein n=1 Tax=Parasediminibacterium sp. JCM 36343 TaxID=3374279 RepID=UPI00397E6E4F